MKFAWKEGIAAAAFTAAVLAAGSPAHAESYTFTNLTQQSLTYFGITSTGLNKAYGINDSGAVVGIIAGTIGGKSGTHAIKWGLSSDGKTATSTDIGTQPLAPTYTSNRAYGYGINGSGQIVGYTGNSPYYAFLYDPATKSSTYLGKPSGSGQSVATAINNSGQVVGYIGEGANNNGPYASPTAFINSGGTNNRIPGATVGGASGQQLYGSVATAISNSGLATGFSTVTGNIARAFIYDTGKLQSDITNGTQSGFQALGTLTGLSSSTNYFGIDINDSGTVVGYTSDTPVMATSDVQLAIPFNNVTNPHAFLYTDASGMIDLGALGGTGYSKANAINNAGVVVGTSNGHAFVYENGTMYDLNNLLGLGAEAGFTLTNATGINNLGQIVGYGTTMVNGIQRERAFALTPTPIPPALFLFGSGLSGMFFMRRRKSVA